MCLEHVVCKLPVHTGGLSAVYAKKMLQHSLHCPVPKVGFTFQSFSNVQAPDEMLTEARVSIALLLLPIIKAGTAERNKQANSIKQTRRTNNGRQNPPDS